MGCSSVNFTVSESNQIVGKIPAILNIDALVKKITAIGLLEFTDFGTSPVAVGDIVRTDFENAFLHQVEGTVRHTIMTNQEIETVSVTKAQTGEYQIAFTLTEQGANIFFDYSSKNTGKYLGILLDKVVLFAPIISTAITDGLFRAVLHLNQRRIWQPIYRFPPCQYRWLLWMKDSRPKKSKETANFELTVSFVSKPLTVSRSQRLSLTNYQITSPHSPSPTSSSYSARSLP
jgi:hypothetical protein